MIKFSDYIKKQKNALNEAKISRGNLDKVADIFKRLIGRYMGEKLYRFDGEKGVVEIVGGIGILFLGSSGRAFRLDYVDQEIVSITLWRQFRFGKAGDFTVETQGINLTNAGKALIDLLKSPKVGRIVLDLEESVSENYLNENNQKVPVDVFLKAVLDHGEFNPSDITREQLKDVSYTYGYAIPGAIWKSSPRRGRFDVEAAVEMSTVTVNRGDNRTMKNSGMVNFEKNVQVGTKQLQKIINEPKAHPNELKDPQSMFRIMRDLTTVVARGIRNSLVVYGGPGIGKTFEIMDQIKKEGLVKDQDFKVIKGRITPMALYTTLFMWRDGKLLVFDDTDSVWGDKDAGNILKAALDSYEERSISWFAQGRTVNVSRRTKEEREEFNKRVDQMIDDDPEDRNIKLPSEFDFNSRIIFISNLKERDFDSAVLNRSSKIDMTMTREQMFVRMEALLDFLGSTETSREKKLEILDFLKEKSKGSEELPSMRTFVAAEGLARSGMPNWRELLEYV